MSTIANRYLIEEKLGSGGMGSVYKAYDKLSGQSLALKQVNVSTQQIDFASRASMAASDDYRLALALEFRTLASLRHPNIISVLDYGFASDRQPFFTMQLVDSPQTITSYAGEKSETEKVKLLITLLQALAYLHRRAVLHRDLKPQNVLVNGNGLLKVMDFGLALHHSASVTNIQETGVGTMAYMAPELFMDEVASIQSDLYAVGLMAYEIFVGKYPYEFKNMISLLMKITQGTPDTSMLNPELAAWIERLISKEPTDRYSSAQEAIVALCQACKIELVSEDFAMRESYLKAARFIGRETEISLFGEALDAAIAGEGSAWLIGGESGIGKSRLLEELRSRALVKGALVLWGSAAEGSQIAFQLWRDILPHLVLTLDLETLEYYGFKRLIPDIERLAPLPTTAPIDIPPDAEKALISQSIVDCLLRMNQPLVLILEDLQWAEQDLEPLLTLLQNPIQNRKLLIIGNYRDDEAPKLSETLSAMQLVSLKRFSASAIEELAASMLGEHGKDEALLNFLRRETEGNVFFMVEVLQALAEEAGSLDEIGISKLPQNILTSGVRGIVQRRLQRLPEPIRDWLKPLAIAGRQLDLALTDYLTMMGFMKPDMIPDPKEKELISDFNLKFIAPSLREEFLILCADASVVEVVENNWRFSHDKIRETILAELTDDERKKLYPLVAEAIEFVYKDNLLDYRQTIAELYERGEVFTKAIHWYLKAEKWDNAYQLAQMHLSAETSIPEERFLLYRSTFAELRAKGQLDDAQSIGEKMRNYAIEVSNKREEIYAVYSIATIELTKGIDLGELITKLLYAEKLAVEHQIKDLLIDVLWLRGWALLRQGRIEEAQRDGEELLRLADPSDSDTLDARNQAVNLLGAVYYSLGNYSGSIQSFQQAREVQLKLKKKKEAMATTNNIAFLYAAMGGFEKAILYYGEAIQLAQEYKRRDAELIYRSNRAGSLISLARYQEAVVELESIKDEVEEKKLGELSELYRYLTEAQLALGNLEDARKSAIRAWNLGLEVGAPDYIASAWRVLGMVAASSLETSLELEIDGKLQAISPEFAYTKSLEIAESEKVLGDKAHTLKEWALYEFKNGKHKEAQSKWQTARELFAKMGAKLLAEAMPENIADYED